MGLPTLWAEAAVWPKSNKRMLRSLRWVLRFVLYGFRACTG